MHRTLHRETILHRGSVLIAVVLAVAAVACRTTRGRSDANASESDSQGEGDPGYGQALQEELLPRASYDLDCPKEALTASCIDSSCHQAGVSGCGRRATYVYRGITAFGGSPQWVMNNALTQSAEASTPSGSPERVAGRSRRNDPEANTVWNIFAQGQETRAACVSVAAALLKDEACKGQQCRAAMGLASVFFSRCKGHGAGMDRLKEAREAWQDQTKASAGGDRCYGKLLQALKERAAQRTYRIRCLENRQPGHVESVMLEAAGPDEGTSDVADSGTPAPAGSE